MFTVVIVGRPNVGKSTLFNRMIRGDSKLKAITDKMPGVTRDINYGFASWNGRSFTVVDTGGFFPEEKPEDEIHRQMLEQIDFAISEADLIIHLLDGKEGLLPADLELSKKLRQTGKEVLWVINKIDDPSKRERIYEFFKVGTDQLISISAITGYGFEELIERISAKVQETTEIDEYEGIPKIAIVGRPNVGKSTIVNALVGKRRMIVSSIPGTTRDAVDTVCTYYGKKYLLIDTAGIKRLSSYRLNSPSAFVEKLALYKSLRSIERADVVVLVVDAKEGIVNQDQKIAGYVEEQKKGLIVLINKWDLIPKEERDRVAKDYSNQFEKKLWFVNYAPYLTVSAQEGKRLTKIFPLVDQILKESNQRVSTAELNRIFNQKIKEVVLSSSGKELKFYYLTQVSVCPPTFVIFVNDPSLVRENHKRFIEKVLRESLSFKYAPISVKFKQRK